MKLRLKILSGFLILVLMLSIAAIWSIVELKSMGTSVRDLLNDNYKSINASKIMIEALEREDSAILLLLLGNWQKGRSIIYSADSLFERGFSIASSNITIPDEQVYIDSLRTKYRIYKNLWERPIVDTHRQGDLNWYFEEVHQAFLDVKKAADDLMFMNDQVMFKTASNLESKANRAIMPAVVAIISALIFSLLFNFFVNYYFINPVIRITKGIQKHLDNKMPFNVEIYTKDEISDLADSINKLCSLQ
jgi:methyl-accepting chemotaxis protein